MKLSRGTLAILFAVMVNMTGVGMIWPILPSLVEELSGGSMAHTATVYGALAVIYSLMQFIFAPFLGALSDRYGRRPVLLLSLAGLGIDNLLLAFAPSIGWMFAGRAIGGILGASFAVANASMADMTEGRDRAAAFGLVGAAFGVGFIVGPLIGGVLGEIGLRLPFLFASALAFANVAFGWFFLAETNPPELRASRGSVSRNPFAALGWLLGNGVVAPLALALFVSTTMQRGLESVWVLFGRHQYGWDLRQVGISLAVVGICFVVVQGFLVRPVVKRFGEHRVVVAGYTLSAAMFLLLAFNTSGLIAYLAIVPHVLGWGMAGPALQSLASRGIGRGEQGLLQGALTSVMGLSAIAGPALSVWIFAFFTSGSAPFEFPGAFFALASLFLLLAALIGAKAPGETAQAD